MNERLKIPIAKKQSYIRMRMFLFLILLPLAALFVTATEHRLLRDALDEANPQLAVLDAHYRELCTARDYASALSLPRTFSGNDADYLSSDFSSLKHCGD